MTHSVRPRSVMPKYVVPSPVVKPAADVVREGLLYPKCDWRPRALRFEAPSLGDGELTTDERLRELARENGKAKQTRVGLVHDPADVCGHIPHDKDKKLSTNTKLITHHSGKISDRVLELDDEVERVPQDAEQRPAQLKLVDGVSCQYS